ncbi:ketosteroid isomerase [Streptomyces misionensis]|uniref:Ketosteroid isomerase n=1 Tax=Streptomyces misionensis TaxID=67331 RepID=A0A5C6JXH2_9ACTN|nr:nuclear transport factor 2 family protein [Streptomyces misionensis]TWV55487.1 ketosteroid isomerase [Streptomyces misionensis]
MPTGHARDTRATVHELLARIDEGEPDRIAELYADDCDWRLDWPEDEHGRPDTPWIRHRATRADAAAHYRELAAHHVPEKAATTVERILFDGEDAVLLGVLRQTAAPTGRSYAARFALHLTVRDGLVVRHHVYEDSLAVARAFAPPAGGIRLP